jgi:hypothetical protein
MVINRSRWLSILAVVISTTHVALGATGPGKTFPTLTVGMKTYTNVTITDISGSSVFLRHSRGFESIQIDSLDAKTLGELGIATSERRPQSKATAKPSDAPSGDGASAPVPSSSASGNRQWNALANDTAQLQGPVAVIVYGSAAVGCLLLLIGHILFIVAAFQTGPWWGVGFALFVVLGIAVPNFVRAKAAVKAKEKAMLSHEHATWG